MQTQTPEAASVGGKGKSGLASAVYVAVPRLVGQYGSFLRVFEPAVAFEA
jgi:hypothetical protein